MPHQAVGTILAGPSTLLREGLCHILKPPQFRVVASGPSTEVVATTALARYKARLLVIESGNSPSAVIEHIALFKQNNPAGCVALLGNHWPPSDIVSSFQAGANVYFAQVTSSEEFLKAVELILLGRTLLPSELLPWMQHGAKSRGDRKEMIAIRHSEADCGIKPTSKNGQLSPREQEILHSISQGASNKLIAREFDISDATVKVHVKTILRKIGVSNRTQAAIWSMTKGGPYNDSGSWPMTADADFELQNPQK